MRRLGSRSMSSYTNIYNNSASGGGLQTLKISGTRLGIILKVLDIGSCPYPFMGWASIRNK